MRIAGAAGAATAALRRSLAADPCVQGTRATRIFSLHRQGHNAAQLCRTYPQRRQAASLPTELVEGGLDKRVLKLIAAGPSLRLLMTLCYHHLS